MAQRRCEWCGKALTGKGRGSLVSWFCCAYHNRLFSLSGGLPPFIRERRRPDENRPKDCDSVATWLAAGGRIYRENQAVNGT